jgi:CheY-like chemotaxis protein
LFLRKEILFGRRARSEIKSVGGFLDRRKILSCSDMKAILFVDDDALIGQVYKDLLETNGFKVHLAYDGEAALDLLSNVGVDLVVLDMFLPKVPGLEVLRRIRNDPEKASIPVVVFSNSYLQAMMKAAKAAGATRCLSKSDCPPEHLLGILREILADVPDRPEPAVAEPIVANDTVSQTAASAETAVTPREASAPSASLSRNGERDVEADESHISPGSHEEIRDAFIKTMPEKIVACRQRLEKLVELSELERVPLLAELYQALHQLSSRAGVVGFAEVGKMTGALEGLIREIFEEPHLINDSSLSAISHTFEMLIQMLQSPAQRTGMDRPPVCLIVDDDPISRDSVLAGLLSVGLPGISVGHPGIALQLIRDNQFELIFLDVDMPEKNGYELCQEVRRSFLNRQTPVLFVTNMGDFQNRAHSLSMGGTDFIAKPFLPLELGLRALQCSYARKTQASGGGLKPNLAGK